MSRKWESGDLAIMASIAKSESGCWLWQKATDRYGYGVVRFHGRNWRAHRLAYESFVGPIPRGLQIDHLCRIRSCVNPEHLEPVTSRENLMRGLNHVARNVMVTACPQGHPYDEANTYLITNTESGRLRRDCRACRREASRRAQARRMAS